MSINLVNKYEFHIKARYSFFLEWSTLALHCLIQRNWVWVFTCMHSMRVNKAFMPDFSGMKLHLLYWPARLQFGKRILLVIRAVNNNGNSIYLNDEDNFSLMHYYTRQLQGITTRSGKVQFSSHEEKRLRFATFLLYIVIHWLFMVWIEQPLSCRHTIFVT